MPYIVITNERLIKATVPFRLYFRRRFLRKYREDPWFTALVKCQAEIASQPDTPKNYVKYYQKIEPYFKLCVVRWLFDDYRKGSTSRCLDIGSGYGTLALYLKKLSNGNAEVYCTDLVRNLSETLRERYQLQFCLHNIELDPFPWEEGFDFIVMTEVLEHLNFHPVRTMQKIRTLLSSNGRLYLSTPDAAQWGHTKYNANLEDMPHPNGLDPYTDDHVHHFDKSELFELAQSVGFKVERCAYSPGVKSRHFNLTLTRA
jgi:SAM-dependent methyltransferase